MKILNVRFKNLNSLRGEWKIDFADPAYADGIFAITGPTGAGKTTILDAICLALYGRTPRLREITQGTNEIMSRHTGECFAEVAFEAGAGREWGKEGGRYRAFWGQHRAHKKPDGPLQPARCEIADMETGQILETGQRSFSAKIEEMTGLTFDQFSRSILLAQGGFSTFLQSPFNERSLILEQLTGTEIYGRISVRVHEVRNAERAELAALEAGMGELRTLEPEERRKLEADLETRIGNEAEAEDELERREGEVTWLEGMASFQKELDILEERHRELKRREEGFELERRRLERAKRALEFGSAYASLTGLRKDQEAEKRALLEIQLKLPELETNIRRAEEALQLSVTTHLERQAEQRTALELLRKVRELDLKQREREGPIQETRESVEVLTQKLAELRAEMEAGQLRLENAQVQMRDTQKFLQRNAVDERLIEQLAGIRSRFDALDAALGKRARLNGEKSALEKQKQETQNLLNDQSALYETMKTKYASVEGLIRKLTASKEEILGTKTLADWRETLSGLVERKLYQERLGKTLESRAECAAARQKIQERSAALDAARKENAREMTAQKNKVQEAEREVHHLENQEVLLRRIRDLEEARGYLRDGEPCPLCGSAEHPYASGNIPQEDEIRPALLQARESLKKVNAAFSEIAIENARIEQEMTRLGEEDSQAAQRAQAIEVQLIEELTDLEMVLPMNEDPAATVRRQKQRTEDTLQKTKFAVERAEKIDRDLQTAREDLESARNGRDQLARSQQEAEFRKESVLREWKRVTQDLHVHAEELKNIQLDLIRQISPLGFKNLPDEDPGQVLAALETRSRDWQERHRRRVELEKQISVLERDLHHVKSNLDSLNLELKEKNETLKKLRSEKDSFRQQRVSLFAEKDPDKEEEARTEAVEDAGRQMESRREAREAALREISAMRSRLEDLGRSIHIRSDDLQKAEISFGRRLIADDFKNEDAYLASCLSEPERKALQDRAQALDVERAELDARRSDRKFGLEELRRENRTDAPLDAARDRRDQLAAELKETQRAIGELRLRLKDEEDFSQRKRERLAVIDRRRRECARWDKLHDLIGSADGQKFRNFAQSLTFEMVIHHANEYLQRMMDRYHLVPNEDRPLELRVIDGYQAGEIRSTQNLSGGETFIVSLALALGLSQMASRKVRMDSLFLDEGFGSLDEEALDSALSTLAALRREGKTIGVISHVEALKERIGVQIEVIPQGDGQSVIRAPGCVGTPE